MEIETYIRERIQKAVLKADFHTGLPLEIELVEGKQKGHGDLTTNVAFSLASREKKSPREIAHTLVNAMEWDDAWIQKVEVAGSGFINFTFSPRYLFMQLQNILKEGDTFGHGAQGRGIKVQIEFVSANPTGPLTIGHGRQAVLGDTIARIMEATGYHVTREYYFNDAGRQMRVLADSVRLRAKQLLGESLSFPEDYYQGEYIREIAKKAVNERGASLKDAEELDYFQKLAEKDIFEDIKKTLLRLSIHFDVYYNEKSLYETGKIDEVVKTLRAKDLVYDKEGAVWFRATRFGLDQDRVVIKSSGEPTYRLPDIAYHKDKMERGFDLIVDIFGADHIATYPDVLAGLRALGYDTSRVKVLIHQFVTLTEGSEKVKMSTRKANFVTLDELMDEVGVDVTRYFFLNRSMSSHLNFDLTLAKTQSEENPVYYVQYAHARICSILRHAKKEGFDPEAEADLSVLRSSEEIALIKILLKYPRVVFTTVGDFELHRIPAYLEEVATIYHRFQHAGKKDAALRVVTTNASLTLARLALCRATRIVLANGLSLMGISRPEKM